MNQLNKIIEKINNDINWDNWKNEDESYWELTEVLYCKLDWLKKENISEEGLETINQVQEILQAITKDIKGD